METRIAPTPSGYLHVGNAANALLAAWWASQEGLALRLRIDDLDATRARPEYLEDIFDLLTWLGIAWTHGPRTVAECQSSREMRTRLAREALDAALARGLPGYACTCTRRTITVTPTHGCPGACRNRDHALTPGASAMRVHVPSGTTVIVDGEEIPLDVVLGDFVLWRREDLPAYQWVSVVEDTHHGTTHILRGDDLRVSTAAQRYLSAFLPDTGFIDADVRHHPLVLGDTGIKLSKSQLGRTTGIPRSGETREAIHRLAVELGGAVGIRVP